MNNVDRFNSLLWQNPPYAFQTALGEPLNFFGISSYEQVTVSGNVPLYTFAYRDNANTIHQIDVNADLEVVYLDGVLLLEPFEKISYYFKPQKFAILLAYTDPEDKYKQNPSLQISEAQFLGTVNDTNYNKAKTIFKDRLLGAINLEFTKDENGLLSVQACVVNEGVIPDWS